MRLFDIGGARYKGLLKKVFLISGTLFVIASILTGVSVFLITLVIINIEIFSTSNIFARFLVFVIFNCGYFGLAGVVVSTILEGDT